MDQVQGKVKQKVSLEFNNLLTLVVLGFSITFISIDKTNMVERVLCMAFHTSQKYQLSYSTVHVPIAQDFKHASRGI